MKIFDYNDYDFKFVFLVGMKDLLFKCLNPILSIQVHANLCHAVFGSNPGCCQMLRVIDRKHLGVFVQ